MGGLSAFRSLPVFVMQPPQTMPIETVTVDTAKIACDGDKASPHPRVFLNLGTQGFVDCPYCGKHYVLKEGAHAADAH
jgi:uncharacterized Zn-finger protein